MTKKFNKGSANQNSPVLHSIDPDYPSTITSGDNNKGNKRSKSKRDKTD